MKPVLFIGHDAGRSGAPLTLLHFLRWLRRGHPELSIDLLLLHGGELEAEYREVAEVHVLPTDDVKPAARVTRKIADRLGFDRSARVRRLAPFGREYGIVFGNTVVSLELLNEFGSKGRRTICWVHEMSYAISRFYSPGRFRELASQVDLLACASRAVETELGSLGVTAPTSVVYEVSPPLKPPNGDAAARVRAELGFPANAFVVGGAGSVEWRKGTDLFLHAAASVVKANVPIYFLWVGGSDAHSEEMVRIQHDISKLGLEIRLKFTGRTTEPGKYLSAIDVFALTSREDPFPLVCLEAASLNKPIICFADAGGMPEFVGRDAGAVVPYGDTDEFAKAILSYHADPQRLRTDGNMAGERVSTRFSAEIACRRLEAILFDSGTE